MQDGKFLDKLRNDRILPAPWKDGRQVTYEEEAMLVSLTILKSCKVTDFYMEKYAAFVMVKFL
jgi:hypothetical protein